MLKTSWRNAFYDISDESWLCLSSCRLELHDALIMLLNAKDDETFRHSTRVAETAELLATHFFPDNAEVVAKIRTAAVFHDIGKIGVPRAVLQKPGKLNIEEMSQIRQHPAFGEAILQSVFDDTDVAIMVRHHHEYWNGQGYPDGLTGETIHLGSRILAVADSYDAMTHDRAYRPRMTQTEALDELCSGAGLQWDDQVIKALVYSIRKPRQRRRPLVRDPE